jgi:hypothetical protein
MGDLRLGDYRDTLAGEQWDALICDPPYGSRTHVGHCASSRSDREINPDVGRPISFPSWSPTDVREFVDFCAPKTRGWFCAMTSHDLFTSYESALNDHNRYVFAPIPCVIRGMTVRMGGDGPSSWCVWMVVSRPRSFSNWGTLPGAYVVSRTRSIYVGGKPIKLIAAVVRDYSRKGDLVCDPVAGMATTGIAAESIGRRFIGSEINGSVFIDASERLRRPTQIDMFG